MGTYFNPRNESFEKAVISQIYIDKTGLIEELNGIVNSEQNCIALSHARRFGKSQAAGMIDAYYSKGSDSRRLFSKFEIAGRPGFEKHLNKYNVIHLDISSFTDLLRDRNLVERVMDTLYRELKEDYPDIPDISDPIAVILQYIYTKSQAKFVIIIDEWDCVIRNFQHRPEMVHEYMQFLHSLFKSEESKHFLALGYITGILPIKKIQDESALNNFREYTMINSGAFTPYFGFTEAEVKKLCTEYNMDFESVKQWYDGYRISGIDMYNPNSVCEAMMRREIDSYWKNTSSFGTLTKFICMNYKGLKDNIMTIVKGGSATVDTSKFSNDLSDIRSKDDVLTALIHLGYLGYKADRKSAYMPNYEVATAYKSALEESGWEKIANSLSQCDELMNATLDKDEERVAQIIDDAHSAYTSILKYNDENSLACAVTMAYFTAPQYYKLERELPAGKGFADLAFIPLPNSGKPPMIIELKYDKTADSAINQIKERRYQNELKDFVNDCSGAKILLVGINYDKETKKHVCVIEEVNLQSRTNGI